MNYTRIPHKVKLIVAVTFQEEEQLDNVQEYLEQFFGELDLCSERFDFDKTNYYEEEMGTGLSKVFCVYRELVDREKVPGFKKIAIEYENNTAQNGKRTVNIDPGYLGEANLVLMTTKNFAHRIYLGDGLYGDCNLIFKDGEFISQPWTYPDYDDEKAKSFFKKARKIYYKQLEDKESSKSSGITYRDAGVNIEEGELAIKRIKKMVKETYGANVLTELGRFGGFFELDNKEFSNPVLVSSVDGVGTKLKIAFASGVHNTIGQDLVNHCVNDILCCGAKPLFFLDYLAFGKLETDVFENIVSGLAKACKEAGAALIGGETAEMPGMYQEGEYDISGTIVGIADKNKILDGSKIRKGDVVVGLPSTGLHTNGYSLARKVLLDHAGYSVSTDLKELNGTVGDELLQIHRCYFREVYSLILEEKVHGIAHITGGGLEGNISRLLSDDLQLSIDWESWEWLPIFKLIKEKGNVSDEEMRAAFNLGIGLAIITDEANAEHIMGYFDSQDTEYYVIGKII